jgi:DNA-binding beta-propeller fold protein YncE
MTTSRFHLRYLIVAAATHACFAASTTTTAGGTVEYWRTVPTVKEFTKPRNFFVKVFDWVAGMAEGKPEIIRPYATAYDSVGRLLVADPGQRGVHLYDVETHKYQFLKGPRGKNLLSPIGVACDAKDNIYVTDSVRAQIYVFDQKGKFQRAIGANAKLVRPTGMAIDRAAQRLYVTDTMRHQVLVLGLDGSLQHEIGKRGGGFGEFNFPSALTLSSQKLYVVDSMNFRVQAFTLDGHFLNTFGKLGAQTGTLNRPKGIAADTFGNLYVVDAMFETVQIFDPEGRLLYYFGSNGTKPGQFQLPTGITIDSRNVITVADSYNGRVQVFRYRERSQ